MNFTSFRYTTNSILEYHRWRQRIKACAQITDERCTVTSDGVKCYTIIFETTEERLPFELKEIYA